MRYGSVCSGIEAATMAWHPLGWRPAFVSEIEPFPCAVLAHHYPDVPNRGDMTRFQEWPVEPIDLLVGGTPCQSFSIAGLRAGLADPRGNLMLTYLAIAAKYQPRWLLWENVPGVLSSADGRDFGTFLGALGQLGYGFAYRVLDAQFCRALGYAGAVPQRRRRVFVVGYLGDWRRAAAVLFDAASLRVDSPPRREAGQGVAGTVNAGAHPGGYNGQDAYNDLLVAHTLLSKSNDSHAADTTQITSKANRSSPQAGDPCHPLAAGAHAPAIAHEVRPINTMVGLRHQALGEATGLGIGGDGDPAYTLSKAHAHAVQAGWAVRRLTPLECCRLQGFPDNFFNGVTYRGKKPADGPIYKALGNSMAVNVMRVLGSRIDMVERAAAERLAA